MRERLVGAFVGLTVAVLALFGVPRAYQVADLVQAQEQRKLERSADLVAVVVREKLADQRPVTPGLLDALLHDGEHLVYLAQDGTRTASTLGAAPTSADVSVRRALPGGGTLTLSRDGDLVERRVTDALVPLVVIVALLLLLAGSIGWLLARWLAQPFQRLATAARQLGTGRLDLDLPRSSIPEAEEIGSALRSSAARVDVLLRHERELAVHASHELRTPVTALRLELEDLALWPQTAPEVADRLQAAVAELDRLSGAITQLLERSRSQRDESAEDVDVPALVAAVLDERRASGADASTVSTTSGSLRAHVDPTTLRQLLRLLLDEAQLAGAGPVTVVPFDAGTHVEVRIERVAEDGPGRATWVPGRQADELAQSLGGRLVPMTGETAGVALRLSRDDPGESGS